MFTKRPIPTLALAGLLCAAVTLLTMVVAIPIPVLPSAYVNLGDVGVYLCAYLLGGPLGALAAGAGSALADILLGYAVYAIPSFIIKALMALVAAMLLKRSKNRRFIALIVAGLIMPTGYFLYEAILYGASAALSGVLPNLAQYAVGVALGGSVLRIAATLYKHPNP